MRCDENTLLRGHRSTMVAGILTAGFLLGGCGPRAEWQKPARVIDSLHIEPGDHVADLGAGDGYFTFRMADATGHGGKVYAVDIDRNALARLAKRAKSRLYAQVETVVADESNSGLAPGSVDLILTCNTYHHLGNRVEYFRRLASTLRPEGRIAIIELDDLPWYQELFHRGHMTEARKIRREMEAAGYRLEAAYDFLPHQNFQVFSAASPARQADNGAGSRL